MTLVKYTAVYQRRDEAHMVLGRGKGEANPDMVAVNQETGEQQLVNFDRVDVITLPEEMSPSDYEEWADEHHNDILENYVPMNKEQARDLNLLAVSKHRADEEVTVRSQRKEEEGEEIDAYVDDDGTVRQESNGAAFNADVYEIIDGDGHLEAYRDAFLVALSIQLDERPDEIFSVENVPEAAPEDFSPQRVIAAYDGVQVWLLNDDGPVQAFYDEDESWGEPGDVEAVADEIERRMER